MKRLTIMLATLAALLLVPAASASAANDVHITIEGNGAGKVVGSPGEAEGNPPVNCEYASPGPASGACDVEHGLALEFLPYITVVAQPAAGSAFVGWTIEEGSDPFEACVEPLNPSCGLAPGGEEFNGEVKLKATFNKAFPLTVTKEGGDGTVVSSPGGIICGSTCSGEFEAGSTVTLTASPATGYAFSKWKGCTVAVGLKCEVAMSAAKTVQATFILTPSLKITKAGSGSGTVKATGISCDESCSEAESAIQTGKVVKITTKPAKGSKAAVIEGGTGSASSCSGESCEFTIETGSSVTVKFDPIPTKTLTVNLTGPGAFKGKVSGKGVAKNLISSKISCGSGCTTQTESFLETDTVTLEALAATGYTFAGWSGGGCSGTGTCVVATSSNKTVSAEFK